MKEYGLLITQPIFGIIGGLITVYHNPYYHYQVYCVNAGVAGGTSDLDFGQIGMVRIPIMKANLVTITEALV